MRLTSGTRLGPYEVVAPIGAGGMGEVYRATDTRLDRSVAIKVLPSETTNDPHARERFEREARALSRLSHPHICGVFDVGHQDGIDFLVMEYLEGETLRERIAGGPIPLPRAVEIGIQMADALDKAHGVGVVHRDLKPGNVMLTGAGVKLLDFGLAKLASRPGAGAPPAASDVRTMLDPEHLTRPGTTLGTVAYMSPEQARGEDSDARGDVFALGAVLYEIVTGRTAFGGPTSAVIFDEILNRTPTPPTSIRPDLPAEIDRVIARATEKDPDLRYQSAADLAAELRRVKRDLEPVRQQSQGSGSAHVGNQGGSLVAPSPAGSGSVPTRTRRVPLLVVAGVALTAAVALGGWLWSTRGGTGEAIDSVAVLPFINDSGNTELDYLSDGLGESISNSLARIETLRVVPRSLVTKYKNQPVDFQTLARDLGVRAVVTGRIVQRGDRLAVQAELIDAVAVAQIWGEQFERSALDVLGLQRDISTAIADNLRPRLSDEEERRLTSGGTESVEAYQAYLRGRFEWNKRTREGLEAATSYFNEAIRIDPKYALAHAGLAYVHIVQAFYGYVPAGEGLREAQRAATNAVKLDDRSAEAHAALGWTSLRYEWDWPKGQREFDRASALGAENATVFNWSAGVPLSRGQFDDAVAAARRAERLDPLSPGFYIGMGYLMTYARRYNEAIDALTAALRIQPELGAAHRYLASVYRLTGRLDMAIAADQKAIQLGDPHGTVDLATSLAAAGLTAEANQQLGPVIAHARQVRDGAFYIALAYTTLGRIDEAFAWLEEAYSNRDPWLPFLAVHPEFDRLHGDPRFDALVRRIGIPIR
ncbi:MAG TPA: protein kinase [Vicinamibacterales bacterium]|nr:protein kinase [Vicinamibacterales bacterium]